MPAGTLMDYDDKSVRSVTDEQEEQGEQDESESDAGGRRASGYKKERKEAAANAAKARDKASTEVKYLHADFWDQLEPGAKLDPVRGI